MADPVLDDLRRHPQLHRALRQLRHKALLTQEQLAALTTAKGQKVSAVFLRKCESDNENTRRFPSAEMLTALLDALGSSPVELYLMLNKLACEPASADASRYRVTTTTQRYATPSSFPAKTVMNGPPLDTPQAAAFSQTDATASLSGTRSFRGGSQMKSMLRSAAPAALPDPTAAVNAISALFSAAPPAEPLELLDPEAAAQRDEIANGFGALSKHQQTTLYGVYTNLRRNAK